MIQSTAESDLGSWSCSEVPLTIEYPLDIMEELRLIVCDEARQLPRGGLEAEGVLFGTRREGAIRILTWRPLARRADMARVLEYAAADPDLQGLVPVGWFTPRVRDRIALTPGDVEFYNGFFPEPWQVALVLNRDRGGAARAGFFARHADGGLKTNASYREFVIEPLRHAGPSGAAQDGSDPAAAIETPSFQLQGSSFGGARWLWVFPVLLAAAVVGFLWLQKSVSAPAPTFSLRVAAAANDVEISWDHDLPAVRHADRATIEVQDGSAVSHIELTASQLQSGSARYQRVSGDVGFAMTVYPSGSPELREYARLVVQESPAGATAKAPATREPPPREPSDMQLRAERDALKGEVEQFKDQVRKESARADRLQEAVRILENRLNVTNPNPGAKR